MTNEPIEVGVDDPRLEAATPRLRPDPGTPEPPAAAPPPLVGRFRLQAEIDAATTRQARKLRPQGRTSEQRKEAIAGKPAREGDDNERLHALFQTEGWEVMKEWLQAREAALLTKLRNPAATLEEIRVWQGSLYEIAGLLAEERRIESLVNKIPPDLPASAQDPALHFPARDLSHIQEGRAP